MNRLIAKRPAKSASVLATLLVLALPVQAAEPAEVIYHGGDIVAVDDKNPTAEAVAVKGGKIVAVGKNDDVFKLKDDATKVIDLGGKALVPGSSTRTGTS